MAKDMIELLGGQKYRKELFETVGLRIKETKKIPTPHIPSWVEIKGNDYQRLEEYCQEIYRRTSQIRPATNLNVDIDKLMRHIKLMQVDLGILWESAGFRNCFPPETTVFLLRSLALFHDFNRFIFNGPLPLQYGDNVGSKIVNRFFQSAPFDYLHSINWMTGEKNPPNVQIYPVPYIFKALDTLGEVDRNPETFFSPGGGYDQWLVHQVEKGRFPIYIPRYTQRKGRRVSDGYKIVEALSYAARDKEFTLVGASLIKNITGQSFASLRRRSLPLVASVRVSPSATHRRDL